MGFWLSNVVLSHRRLGRPVTAEKVLAGLTSDSTAERWYAVVGGLLLYGHLPVMALLACWGAALVAHSTVRAWREPLAEQVKITVGEAVVLTPDLERVMRREPTDHIPSVGTFWGAVFAGAFATRAAFSSWTLDGAPFLDRFFGPALWVALLWGAVAVLVAVSAAGMHLRRRRYLRDPRNRPRLRRHTRQQPLTFRPLEPPTDRQRRADGHLVGAIICAALGLGPLGLALGVWRLRYTSNGWGGALLLVVNGLSSVVMGAALVIAVT
ncbi:hypothetical protein AA0Y32_08715 [Georgenia phoenicis]|uniref:hypothetical protein n=1 Tax=unclassified Georgenia TaxID=2626815 RepID=UPI0039B073D6